MGLNSTHTYAVLELSPSAFAEVKAKLELAGYHERIERTAEHGLLIDMHGIACGLESAMRKPADSTTRDGTKIVEPSLSAAPVLRAEQ